MKTLILISVLLLFVGIGFAQPQNPTWQVIFQTQDGVFTESCSGGAALDNHKIAYVYLDLNMNGPDSEDICPRCVFTFGMACIPEESTFQYRNFALEPDGTINSPVFNVWRQPDLEDDVLRVYLRIFVGQNQDSCYLSPVTSVPLHSGLVTAVMPRSEWICTHNDVAVPACYGSHVNVEIFPDEPQTQCITVCPDGYLTLVVGNHMDMFHPPVVRLSSGCDTTCAPVNAIHFSAGTWIRQMPLMGIWTADISGQDAGCVTVSIIDQIPSAILDTMIVARAGNLAQLTWNTNSEVSLAQFMVWHITTTSPHQTRFVATIPATGQVNGSTYSLLDDSADCFINSSFYLLAMVDEDGQEYAAAYADHFDVLSTPGQHAFFANSPTLSAFPNPFNPSTSIAFTLPQTGNVRLVVYDITGREVRELHEGTTEAGEHHFTFDGAGLASGIYFARLESAGLVKTQKLLLLK